MAGFGDAPLIQNLAVPGVCILISFLAYSSQLLFHFADLKPGPLSRTETLQFNFLLLCLWYTYYKACTVDPGRFTFSTQVLEVPSSDDGITDDDEEEDNINGEEARLVRKKGKSPRARWCRKCAAPKPPRAHHCRTCNRCIPKMDHHCPWTGNCVSLTTFPHFWRFLLYANLSLWYLAALLFRRFAALWADRNLPSYLGPSMPVLIHLSLLLPISFFTTLGLGIMFYATSHDWLENTTTIEGFEIHRHTEIIERDRRGGAWWSNRAGHDDDDEDDTQDPDVDPNDRPVIIEKVEFPYDIGYWANLTQAMGSSNPLVWVLPWSGAPAVSTTEGKGLGWEWEENGFNDTEGLWPPPDPEKRPPRGSNGRRRAWPGARGSDDDAPPPLQYASRDEEIQAFRKRQEEDLRRREETRARLMAELEEVADFDPVPIPVDNYDDDDVPLAELIRQRKIRRRDDQDQ